MDALDGLQLSLLCDLPQNLIRVDGPYERARILLILRDELGYRLRELPIVPERIPSDSLLVRMSSHASIMLSHDALVGVK